MVAKALRKAPTWKQKEAFAKVVKGSTITQAMRDVGYSESTCRRTNKLTASDAWKELMAKHLPDSLLAKVHEEGLKAVSYTQRGEEVEDFAVRHRYLDTAYKLKNKYEEHESAGNTLNNLAEALGAFTHPERVPDNATGEGSDPGISETAF